MTVEEVYPAVKALMALGQHLGADAYAVLPTGDGRWMARLGTHYAAPIDGVQRSQHNHSVAIGATPTEAADAVAAMTIYYSACHYCQREAVTHLMWHELAPYDWCVWRRVKDRWQPSCPEWSAVNRGNGHGR